MVVRRLIRYAKPHRKALAGAFLLLLLGTLADLAGPYLIKVFIDDYLEPRWFPFGALIGLAAGYLVLHVSSVVFQYFQLLSFQQVALRIVHQLRTEVFGKVQHLGLSFFDRTAAGGLVSRITNDTEAVKELYVSVLSTFVQNIVFLLGIFAAMFLLDVRLAAVCLLLLPLLLVLMNVFRRLSSKVFRVTREKLAQLNAILNESLQGMNIIQAMRQEKRLRDQFAKINGEYYTASIKNIRLNGLLLRPAVDLLRIMALMLVVYFFGRESLHGVIEIGVVYAFINYLDRFFEPVNTMMMRLGQLQQALIAGERVFELLDSEEWSPGEKPKPDVRERAEEGGSEPPTIQEGRIDFDSVTFSYDGQTDVLKNISFTALPGQTVALVGHTGSGKSSIINLLLHFYSIRGGEIRIDHVPLSDYTNEELRRRMGLVLQDPFLFTGTVRDNIRLHDGTVHEDAVREAVELVQLDSFIRKLPHGYEEPVVERGATFSSGQRQLLSFARTMARQPAILLLDEATAHVDTETEEAIQDALGRMRKGRTTLAVAHRLSTIQDADLILVLHQGEIVERGTHQELLNERGLYYTMYRLQQGASESLEEPNAVRQL
ncbi:ABC transporter ATP-binding protein [Paenibacillus sp. J2TS4]|uniref:ABC transporter ATP-binding protein n=1 Tax=Paenibacillus sp. J2TS4 TaxID=2807194 RepID=UPI001B0F3B3A|nr:ABC transporter transmembrane domain-containing protein [Paenibacillus sp. J2TS4]GIP35671.1 multidrug ABC transporter ATP-binding protein [Paenibacillus sp. J2TS4]